MDTTDDNSLGGVIARLVIGQLALLGFMDFRAAAMVLVNAGVPSEHAFLALKAAEILGRHS